MAQALITITAEGILKKVLSLAAAEIVLAWGYEEKLTRLHETLDLIRAKLHDAERQKGTEAVMVWLKQLKHAVSEADDVLDEIDYEMLRREVEKHQMTRKVLTLPCLKRFSFRREMGHKIEKVSRKLVEINKQANDLGLQNEQPHDLVPNSHFRETDPYLDEFKVVGRENEELRIIQLLTQPRKEEKLTIVPIVGMGGMGKTTLAKSIYNNPTIKQHFGVKGWLCVSVKVEVVEKLLAKIYESLAGEECKSQMRANLITQLQNKLGSTRYFLVLDDVWDDERAFWDDFKSCMLKVNSQSGSGILVTTRSLEIGTKAMSEDFHALQSLPDDICWSIFKERAFIVGQPPLPELEEIGWDIMKKCRGLPLLVNVIGGVLRNCNDKEKWLSIKGSKVWDLEEVGDRVQNSLKLSFDYLPNSTLKQCFLYCSIFKKDTVLKREELIRLWMALGLVYTDERRNKEAEDVGNDIFQILVSSSLFQDVKTDEYGYVTGSMHDLVHDLLVSLCKDESICLMDPVSDDIAHIPHVKHLSILPKDGTGIPLKNLLSVLFKNNISRTLHTMIFDGEDLKSIAFHGFKNLKILKLMGYVLEKLDDSIGELVHLRYLDLSETPIKALPNSITKLYHLQTLKLLGCYYLKKLPKDMNNLTSLRHLMYGQEAFSSYTDFDEDFPIRNVGRLTSLRTLPSFRVGRQKRYQISELGPLKHLAGELCITNLEKINNKEDAAKAYLSRKKNLYGVHFCWSWYRGVNQNDKDVLDGLQPHGNVKKLTIKNFFVDRFPAWVEKMAINIEGKWTPLNKLMKIKLFGCNNCVYLPVLEDLPFLQELVLEDMNKLTCLSTSLGIITGSVKPLSPSLRLLRLMRMSRLVQWNIDPATSNSSIMLSPVLKELIIYECPSIIHLDECHPHPLVSLRIGSCKRLVSIKSIQGLTSLEILEIEYCTSLLEMPYLHNFKRHPLKALRIIHCTKLTSMPWELFDCFSLLNELELGPFSKELHSYPSLQGIKNLRNLYWLTLWSWPHWESIPEQVQHLNSLGFLGILGFGMRELPSWLANMSSIRFVTFYDCKRLNEKAIERGKPRQSGQLMGSPPSSPSFLPIPFIFTGGPLMQNNPRFTGMFLGKEDHVGE